MSDDRMRILGMLAEGKITAQEAALLLDALPPEAEGAGPGGPSRPVPKFLMVKITGEDTVDVRVPLGLLRAGLKLTTLIPPQAMEQINKSLGEQGMSFDLKNLKPADIEELIACLRDFEVDIRSDDGDHVKVWCA